MSGLTPEDIAAARAQGDLKFLMMQAGGLTAKVPAQRETDPADEAPCYHIRRPGAWPCGTAASGPTPPPCDDCRKETRP